MEVDEIDAAPAAHHPPGGHRGVDATREESEDAPARPDRQAARAGHLLERDEGAAGQDVEPDRQRRGFEVDGGGGCCLDARAEHAIHFGRGEGEALVAALRSDPEAPHALPREVGEDGIAHARQRLAGVGGEPHLVRERVVGEPEDPPQAGAGRRPRRRIVQRQQQARRGARHRPDRQVGAEALHVLGQAADEERPVAPLERNLVITEHDDVRRGGHAAPIAQHPERGTGSAPFRTQRAMLGFA